MKEKLTKNAPLKLISLLCAFLVWLAVVNVANPIQTKSIEIPVNITNDEVLESSNLTYEIEGKMHGDASNQCQGQGHLPVYLRGF